MKDVESVMMNVQIDEAEAKNSCSDVERIMSGFLKLIAKKGCPAVGFREEEIKMWM